jgi:hypothetical protein
VFIVDDVAFIRPEHGDAIASEVEERRIRKSYYLETRSDVLLRNTQVFQRRARLGLRYMFLGIEAIDETGLDPYRKRVSPDDNLRALEAARRLGITVAINLIVDPAWDAAQFRLIRQFATARSTTPDGSTLTTSGPSSTNGDRLLRLSLPAGAVTASVPLPGAATSQVAANSPGTVLVADDQHRVRHLAAA